MRKWMMFCIVGMLIAFQVVWTPGVSAQYQPDVDSGADNEEKTVTDLFDKNNPAPDEEASEELTTMSSSVNYGSYMLNMLAALAFILLLIYLLYRLFHNKSQVIPAHSLITPIGGYALGPQKSVQVVKIGKRIYILGVAEQITLIQMLEEPEELAIFESKSTPKENHFRHVLSRQLQRMKDHRNQWKAEIRWDRQRGDGPQ